MDMPDNRLKYLAQTYHLQKTMMDNRINSGVPLNASEIMGEPVGFETMHTLLEFALKGVRAEHKADLAQSLADALEGIMRDLPSNKDWLDPVLEAMAKDALANYRKGAE